MSIDIHGREYVMVNERIKIFRDQFEGWSLTSDLVKLTDDCCVVKATVTDKEGNVMATGYAQEDRSSSNINKTSYLENCETSAWGRALACLGIGIDGAIASTEEVVNAVINQNPEQFSDKASDKQIAYLKTLLKNAGYGEDEYLASYGVTSFEELPKKDISLDINKLKVKS